MEISFDVELFFKDTDVYTIREFYEEDLFRESAITEINNRYEKFPFKVENSSIEQKIYDLCNFVEKGYLKVWIKDGLLHRTNGPAYINLDRREVRYIINGSYVENLPCIIIYDENGKVYKEMWCKYNKYHRDDDQPAISVFGEKKSFFWITNGIVCRKFDRPSFVSYYPSGEKEYEKWYYGSVPHRISGPAIIHYYSSGSVKYYVYFRFGKLFNDLGPAIVKYHENGNKEIEIYLQNKAPGSKRIIDEYILNKFDESIVGQIHRIEGPAIIIYNVDGTIFSEAFITHGVLICWNIINSTGSTCQKT